MSRRVIWLLLVAALAGCKTSVEDHGADSRSSLKELRPWVTLPGWMEFGRYLAPYMYTEDINFGVAYVRQDKPLQSFVASHKAQCQEVWRSVLSRCAKHEPCSAEHNLVIVSAALLADHAEAADLDLLSTLIGLESFDVVLRVELMRTEGRLTQTPFETVATRYQALGGGPTLEKYLGWTLATERARSHADAGGETR